MDIAKLEVQAQDKLLEVAKRLKWTPEEIEQIKRAKASWQLSIEEMEQNSNG